MKLTKTIYTDKQNTEWVMENIVLPNVKFWIAECDKLGKSFREKTKKELKLKIEQL